MAFSDFVPDVDALLRLAPEEVGGAILEFLQREHQPSFHVDGYFRSDRLEGYPREARQAAMEALMEGIAWLLSQGLIMPRPEQAYGWYQVTRRGQGLQSRDRVRAYRAAAAFPEALLHATILK